MGCAPGAVMNYDSEGNCFGSISEVPPKARKLRWDVPQECQNVMQKCLKVRIFYIFIHNWRRIKWEKLTNAPLTKKVPKL